MAITAKDLAREFDRRPKWVRKVLRQHFTRGVGRRWEWNESEAHKLRQWMDRYLKEGEHESSRSPRR